MTDYFRVGIYINTHGIKGEIKVFPTTEDLHRFDYLKELILDTKEGHKPFKLENVKYFKGQAILKLEGVDNINDIEKYKGCDVLVSRENAIPLGENEHYVADLLGLPVITDTDRNLGTLSEVMQTGANDVYVIKKPEGGELLVPVIDDCVLEVAPEKGYIKVHLLDGLEDL